jgi:hypothetical protein
MDLGRVLEALVQRGTLLKRITWLVLIGLVIADFLLPERYERFPWEAISGFGALYGFLACVLIIVFAKVLGYLLLFRPEGYYDDQIRAPTPDQE